MRSRIGASELFPENSKNQMFGEGFFNVLK